MNLKLLFSMLLVAALFVSGGQVSQASPAGSCTALENSDLPYIEHGSIFGVANQDSTNYHNMVCPVTIVAPTATTTEYNYVYGSNNGMSQTCYAEFYNTATGAWYYNSNSTSALGMFNYQIATTIAAGTYYVSTQCYMPPYSFSAQQYSLVYSVL